MEVEYVRHNFGYTAHTLLSSHIYIVSKLCIHAKYARRTQPELTRLTPDL